MFLAVIAVSYLVSRFYKQFEPTQIYLYLIGSLIFAVVMEFIKPKKTN